MRPRKSTQTVIRAALLLGVSSVAFGGAAFAQTSAKSFEVEAQPASSGIPEFAREANVQILVSADDVSGKSVNAVHGAMPVDEALQRLLAGTGIAIASDDGHTITLTLGAASKNVGAAGDQAAQNGSLNDMETVVVTGTNIRGIDNLTSPTITFDRDEIQMSGYSNTDDFIRSIPQNFGGGQLGGSPDGAIGPGRNGGNNIDGASAINLRGLGESSTLTLLDGHRVAPSAFGGFVDVSEIPIIAIDRVDLVTDGASAIYGSDAVAGVANFVLRKDFDGAETDVQYGTVTSGDLNEYTVAQMLGKTWDSGGGMLALQYHDRSELPTSERSFTASAPQPNNIYNPFLKYSLVFNGHQDIASNLEVFGDAFVNRDKTGSLLTQVAVPAGFTTNQHTNSDTNNFSGGFRYKPFGDWLVEGAMSYSQQITKYEFSAYGGGGVALGVFNRYQDTMDSYDLNVSGSLFALPGGDAKLAFGLSDRDERAGINNVAYGEPPRGFTRDVFAEYAETYLPVIGEKNGIPFVEQLTFSAAIRHDHYSDVGDTTNPKLGALWTPVDDLDVRATWGTAFRAPSAGELLMADLGSGAYLFNYPVENATGTGTQNVFIEQAYNKPLTPEKAKTWTVGFDWHPSFFPGAKLTADYYDVDYRDRIVLPPFDVEMLEHPNLYGSLLTSLPSDAAAAAYLANFEATPGDQFIDELGTGSTGVRYAYNDSLQNAAVSHQNGVDIQGEYAFPIGANNFDARANLAVIDEIDTQFSSTSTAINEVNTYSNPPQFRMRDELSWTRGEWRVNGALNYTNSYTDTSATPYGKVDAYTTFDLNIRYSPEFAPGFSVSVSAINLFDQDPPYVNGGVGLTGIHYDVGNASPLGRFISFELQKVW